MKNVGIFYQKNLFSKLFFSLAADYNTKNSLKNKNKKE